MRPRRLLLAPPPYPDEAVSSWLSRIAVLHGMGVQDLAHDIGLKSQDPDVDILPADLTELAELTRTPSATIQSMVLSNRVASVVPPDLIQWNLNTGLRAQVCGLCLDGDSRAGRDHYVRRDWLSVWALSCAVHHTPLTEVSAMDVVPVRGRSPRLRRVRFARSVDEVVDPYRRLDRGFSQTRPPTLAQAELLSADILLALQGRGDLERWECAGSWQEARSALLAFADLLVSRSQPSGLSLYAVLLGSSLRIRPDLSSPREGVLPRLVMPYRGLVLDALSCLFLDPLRYCVTSIHADGPAGFYNTFRLTGAAFRGPLARVATLDPMAALLALAAPNAVRALISTREQWPRRLQMRLGHASAVALAAA